MGIPCCLIATFILVKSQSLQDHFIFPSSVITQKHNIKMLSSTQTTTLFLATLLLSSFSSLTLPSTKPVLVATPQHHTHRPSRFSLPYLPPQSRVILQARMRQSAQALAQHS